jgi:hypothetical protein
MDPHDNLQHLPHLLSGVYDSSQPNLVRLGGKKEATTAKKEKPVSKAATNLKVWVCISLQKCQIPSLIKAAALTNTDATLQDHPGPYST